MPPARIGHQLTKTPKGKEDTGSQSQSNYVLLGVPADEESPPTRLVDIFMKESSEPASGNATMVVMRRHTSSDY